MRPISLIFATGLLLTTTTVNAAEWSEEDNIVSPEAGYTFNQMLRAHELFNLSDWNVTGGNVSRFTYLNLSRFFPVARIARDGQVSLLEEAPNSAIGQILASTHDGKMTLDAWSEGFLDGVIVVLDGKIVYERYPRMRPTDSHVWWSVTKSLTGTMVGLLEQDGLIDVTQSIDTYIPELVGTDWAGMPVIDVLDHASGMNGLEADDPDSYTDPDSPYGKYEASLGSQPSTPNTPASTYDYVASLTRQKPNGEKFEYTSVNTFMVGWLAERVSKKPYAELVQERIWTKMGADGDAGVVVSRVGAPGAHGMITSRLRDLARYGMLFTDRWDYVAKERVIPKELIARIQNEGRSDLFQTGLIAPQITDYLGETPKHETRQWDFVLEDGDFGKSGFHGQTLYISPSKNLVVASFATGIGYDTWSFAREIAKSLD